MTDFVRLTRLTAVFAVMVLGTGCIVERAEVATPQKGTSSLTIAPSVVPADGVTPARITATLHAPSGAPLSGAAVRLRSTCADAQLSGAPLTNSTGSTEATLTRRTAGRCIVTGEGIVGGAAFPLAQTALVTFTAQQSTEEPPPSPDASALSIALTPNTAVADGQAAITVRIAAVDAHGLAAVGQAVMLSASGTDNLFVPVTPVVGADGTITATLTSTRAEAKTITAALGNTTAQATATFVAGAADADASGLTVVPAFCIANGSCPFTAQVNVRDSFGNGVAHVPVSLTSSDLNDTIPGASGATDAAGLFAATFTTQAIGDKILTAQAQHVTLKAPYAGVAASPNVLFSALSVGSGAVVADGTSVAAITVHVADDMGRLMARVPVSLRALGLLGTLQPDTGTTDDNGDFVATYKSASVGNHLIIATLQNSVSLTQDVAFISGAPSFSTSQIFVSPSKIAADNNQTADITVLLKDSAGNPAVGAQVNFLASNAGLHFASNQANSDEQGRVTGRISSAAAGNFTISAATSSTTLTAPISCTVGPPNPGVSALSITPNSVLADDTSLGQLELNVFDLLGNPVPDVAAHVLPAGPTMRFSLTDGLTDAQGRFRATVSAAQAQNTVVSINVSGTNVSSRVRFLPGLPSPIYSSIAAQPNMIIAGGGPSVLVVSIKDASGNPVPGAAIALQSRDPGLLLTASSGTADAAGNFYTQVRATLGGVKTVEAQVGSMLLTQKIAATAGVPSATTSSLLLNSNTVVADGTASATLTFKVRDILGNPVIGAPVTFTGTHLADTFAPAQSATDASGTATTSWSTTRAGASVLRAQAQEVSLQAAVAGLAGAPSSARSSCTAEPNQVRADGITSSTATFVVRDAFSNAVSGAGVTVAAQGTQVAVAPGTSTTSALGAAVVSATSTVAQQTALVATVGGIQIPCALTFVPGPASAPDSIASVVPSLISADGSSLATFSARFLDAQRNPIVGREVILTASGTGNTLSANRVTTDAQGRISVTLQSTTPEAKTISAQVDGTTVSATATFVTGPPGALSTLTIAPDTITADGSSQGAITVTVRDNDGHLITGQTVSLQLTGGPGTVAPPSGTTDASGQLAAVVTSTTAGTRVLTASAGAQDITAALTFAPGPLAVAASMLAVSPNQLVADGTSSGHLQFVAADAFGNLIENAHAAITSDSATLAAAPQEGNTTASGQFVSNLTNTVAQTSLITVTSGGQTFSTPVTWLAGPVTLAASSLVANPNGAVADGSDAVAATLLLRDNHNNPVPNTSVTLSATGSDNSVSPGMGTTDSAGQLSVVVRSHVAEGKTLSASFDGKTLSTPITFRAGPPSQANSSLALQPNELTADGASYSALTFTLKDAFGNAISGQAFSGSASGTTAAFSGTTDAAGLYSASLVSTVAQSENITIASGGLQWLASVRFVPGPPAAANSTMTVSPTTLVANAVAQATIQVTMRDAYNNVIPNAAVRLDNTSPASDVYGATSGSTNSSGLFSTTLTSTLARSTSLRAELGTAPTPPSVNAPIQFLPGPADGNVSTLVLSPNFTVADGNASAQLQIVVKDAFNNAVGGAAVRLSAAPGSCTFNPTGGIADASGSFLATIASTVAQPQMVTASLGAVGTNQSVTRPFVFVAGPPIAETSSLVVSPNTVVADGSAQATATITLRDAQGNLAPNQTVTLASTGGNNTLVQPSASGQPSGVYVGSLSSIKAQAKTLTAYFNGRSLQAGATFVAGSPTTARSTLTAAPSSNIWANGQQSARVTATFADTFGNLASGQTVTFASDAPDTFAPASGTTAADGTLSVLVRGRTAGTHTVTATSGAAQPSVQVAYVPAAYPSTTSLTASPNAITADANNQATLTLTARDGNNAPLSGAAVRWGGLIPGFTYTPSKNTTDASGVATSILRGNIATQQTAHANLTGLHITVPISVSTLTPSCSQTMSYNGLPWPEVNIGEQMDAAVADLNQDGIPDLAVLNVSGTYALLMGKSGRAWQPPVSYPTGRTGVAMFLQDLNGDSKADLVVLSRDESLIYVHLGRGDGTFNAANTYATDAYPDDLVLADVNNDGIADAVEMNASRKAMSVLMGQSNGSFQPRVEYPLGVTPAAFTVQSVVTSSNDIIFTNAANNTVAILPNQGSGSFGAATTIAVGSSPKPVVAGDLTGDGLSDLVVSHDGEKTFGVLRNLGSGSFAAMQRYTTPDNITALVLAQLGGSAALDLVAYSKWQSSSYSYENSGDGNFVLKTTLPAGSNVKKLHVVDIDGDSKPDLLLPMQSPRTQLQMQYTDGNYNIFAGKSYTASAAVQAVAADFDKDGAQDVFVAGFGGPHRLYLGSASGQLGTPTTITNDGGSSAARPPVVRDFDGDGFLDVALSNSGSKSISVYLHGAPGPFKTSVKYTVGNNPGNITSGDINDDGIFDLVVVNQDDATLSILLGQSDGTFVTAPTVAVGASPADAVLADFDGNGTLDIAVANGQAGTVGILFNDGQGGWSAMTSYAMSAGAKQLARADFNADGKVDLAVLGTGVDPVSVLLNTGGTFTLGPVTNRISFAKQMLVGDFNGDGRPDIAALSGTDPTVNIYLNSNGTAFQTGRPYATGAVLPSAFGMGDLNGDGVLDFIAVHNGAAKVTTMMQDGCY